MSKAMKAAAVAVFTQYTEAKECFVTEDGQAFLNANYAANHAAQSGMPTPVRFGRDPESDVVMSADDNAKLEGERIAKQKAAQAKADAKAKAEADAEAAKAKEEAEAKAKADAEAAKKTKKKK